MGYLITDNYNKETLVVFLNETYLGLWAGRFNSEIEANIIDIPSILQEELDLAVSLFDFNSSEAATIETTRITAIREKAEKAIVLLSKHDVQIDLLADGIIALTRTLIQQGVISLADLPPKAVETARLWDDDINPIKTAMQIAIEDGSSVEDFNP